MNKEFLNILPNSNYSSFIQHPFKVVYSGALPAQSRSNNVVLRPERNRAECNHTALCQFEYAKPSVARTHSVTFLCVPSLLPSTAIFPISHTPSSFLS